MAATTEVTIAEGSWTQISTNSAFTVQNNLGMLDIIIKSDTSLPATSDTIGRAHV